MSSLSNLLGSREEYMSSIGSSRNISIVEENNRNNNKKHDVSITTHENTNNNSNNIVNPIPLVLVEGFLAVNNKWYWGSLELGFKKSILPNRQIFYVEVGSVSSLHDRACEIFYQIKGGTVDYGEYHSRIYRHNRYGKTYTGLYPRWDADHPIHIAGYSYGGNTIWYLQQMLHWKMFDGHDTSANWIYSLTGFVAPFMGTPLVEAFGARATGVLKGSALDYLLFGIILYDKLKLKEMKHNKLGFVNNTIGQLNDGDLEKKHCVSVDFLKLLDPYFRVREDNAAVDMLPHRMQALNLHSITFKDTYYRSYAANFQISPKARLKYLVHRFYNAFFLSALSLHYYKPNRLSRHGPLAQTLESKSSLLRFNDGICPTKFSYHPGPCNPDFCSHKNSISLKSIDKKALENNNDSIRDDSSSSSTSTSTSSFRNKASIISTSHSENIQMQKKHHLRGIWDVIEVYKCTHRGIFPYGSTSNKDPQKTLLKRKIHAKVLEDYVQYLVDLDIKYNKNPQNTSNIDHDFAAIAVDNIGVAGIDQINILRDRPSETQSSTL